MYLYYYLTIERENNLPLFSFRLDNSLCLVYKKISIQFVLDHELIMRIMNWTKPGDYTYIFSQRNTFIPNHKLSVVFIMVKYWNITIIKIYMKKLCASD